ncbi:MAG: hypothetical protein AAGG68_13190 [Bacteroidota bacterium]
MKTILKYIFVINWIAVFGGCEKDQFSNLNISWETLNCLETERSEEQTGKPYDTCTFTRSDSIKYCEVIDIGTVELDSNTKKFLPYYCLDNEVLTFRNGRRSAQFRVVRNGFAKIATRYVFSDSCQDNRSLMVCQVAEAAGVTLISDDLDVDFSIGISTKINRRYPKSGAIGDFLQILRPNNPERTSYTQVMSLLITPRTYSLESSSQEFFESLELDGRTFTNVYSVFRSEPSENYKIYYNEKYGIVGLVDLEEKLWTLDI